MFMKTNRIFYSFMMLIFVLSGNLSNSILGEKMVAHAADLSNQGVVTDIRMDDRFVSGNGSNDHMVKVYADFVIPDSAQAGDTFSIKFDKALSSIGSDTDIPVKSSTGIVIGTMAIDPVTNTVTITLNENIEKLTNVRGSLSFEREANRSAFTKGSGTYPFTFTSGGKTYTDYSYIQFTNGGYFNNGLAKYAVSYDESTGLHKWVIIVNPNNN